MNEVKRRVLVATIICAGVVFLDTSLLNVALPSIQRSLNISTSTQQWVASAYLLTLSVLLLASGRVADIVGRHRMFVLGLGTYAVIAVIGALSVSGTMLVAVRGLQGVAGAMLVPTSLAIINATFPAEERGRAIGTWAAWSGITTILGPVLGGVVIDRASWRYALLITPVLCLVALAVGWRIPESRDETASRRIDVAGLLLLTGGVGGIIFALIQGPISGWSSAVVVVPAIIGVALVPTFILYERRAESPILPFGLFNNHNLAVANIVTFFVYAGLYGTFFYIPLYVQSALGLSATRASMLLIPTTIVLFFLSPVSGRLNDRYGPRWLLFFGPLIAATGFVILSFAGPGDVYTVLVPGIVVFGVGLGFTVTPVTATAIGSAETRYSGVASGFNNAVSRVAGLVAIALMGVIVVQLWQASLSAAALNAPPQVSASLASVRSKAFVQPTTLGQPPADAAEVKARSLAASKRSFQNGILLAAALVATGGVVAGVFIRNPRRNEAGPAGVDAAGPST